MNGPDVVKDTDTNIIPIIITCVILSLAFLFVVLLVHFVRTGTCYRIVDSFKLTKDQVQFRLPKISFKSKKNCADLSSNSKKVFLLNESNITSSDDPSEIIKAETGVSEDSDKIIKRSSRLFDAFRTSFNNKVERNSSVISAYNNLFIVHKEVENFEEEALSLLSNVMTKHLVSDSLSDSGEIPNTIQQQCVKRISCLRSKENIDITYDKNFEVTFLDDEDGPSTSL